MKYTVLWKPDAEQQLTSLWTESRYRHSISTAANEIDRTLRTSPEQFGESRDNGERILLIPPMGVLYRIVSAERKVEIISVWLFSKF